jgi:hypothetical protein
MSEKIIQIPVSDLLLSLEEGYKDYKQSLANDNGEVDLAHVKGYCTTIEQILGVYGGVTSAEMMEIKNPILGNISLRRKKHVDLDTPTFIRKQKIETII